MAKKKVTPLKGLHTKVFNLLLDKSKSSYHEEDLPSDSDEYTTPPNGSYPTSDTPIADILQQSGNMWAQSFKTVMKKVRQREVDVSKVWDVLGIGHEDSIHDAVINLSVCISSQVQQIKDMESNFRDIVGIHDDKFCNLGCTIAELNSKVNSLMNGAEEAERENTILADKNRELEGRVEHKDARNKFLQECLKREEGRVEEQRAKLVELTALLGGNWKV